VTVDELLAAACPVIRDTGWAFYYVPATTATGAALGLDAGRFYVLGRAGVLGDVEPAVVSAAFGYFNPDMIARAWNAGRAVVAPRVAGAAFMECCRKHGRATLSAVVGLDTFVEAADRVLAATDGDGLALFAATAAEPLADDLPARAMQLITVLREYRGSAHLVALRSVGLASKTALFAKRPGDVRLFGWRDGDGVPTVDAEVSAQLSAAEEITDSIVRPAYAVLDEQARVAFVDGLHAIRAALSAT